MTERDSITNRLRHVADRLNPNSGTSLRPDHLRTFAQIHAELISVIEAIEAMQQQVEPVAVVRVHRTGGNAGIAWSAASVDATQSLPMLADGTKLYASAPPAQQSECPCCGGGECGNRFVQPAQQAGEAYMQFSLGEAKALVELFGGSNTCMVVREMPERVFDGETHPAGKYAFCLDCPEEGATYLGPHDPDTEEHDAPEQPAQGVPADCLAALRAYQQADADGCMVTVSRQALDMAIEVLAASPAPTVDDDDGEDRARKLYEPDEYEDAFKGREAVAPAAVPEGLAKAIARMDECRAGCDAGEPFYADVRAWDTIRAKLAAAPAPEVSNG